MLQLVTPARRGPAPFTAGDLIEGMGFLEPVYRRAVLFGLEQGLGPAQVMNMTHTQAAQLPLTVFSQEIVSQQPRHIRLGYLFWDHLQDGMVAPLLDLEDMAMVAYSGMSWGDLANAYGRMVWIDDQIEADYFLMVARQEGLM